MSCGTSRDNWLINQVEIDILARSVAFVISKGHLLPLEM